MPSVPFVNWKIGGGRFVEDEFGLQVKVCEPCLVKTLLFLIKMKGKTLVWVYKYNISVSMHLKVGSSRITWYFRQIQRAGYFNTST